MANSQENNPNIPMYTGQTGGVLTSGFLMVRQRDDMGRQRQEKLTMNAKDSTCDPLLVRRLVY